MTRRAIPLCLGLVAGEAVGFAAFVLRSGGVYTLIGVAAFSLLCVLMALPTCRSIRMRAAVFFVTLFVGAAHIFIWANFKIRPLEALSGREVNISGTVVSVKGGDTEVLTVSGDIDGIHGKAVLYANGLNVRAGDSIKLTAKVSKMEKSYFFDEITCYFPDGIFLKGSVTGLESVEKKKQSIFYAVRELSENASQKIRLCLPGENGELLDAMVTGSREQISDSLSRKMSRAGISHIMSVSGLHVSVVALALWELLKKIRTPKFLAAAVTESAIVGFVVFSGARVSAIRAALMMTAMLLSELFLRRTDSLNTICIAAALINIFIPGSVADISFQLTFSGVIGVAVAAPAIIREFKIRSRILKTVIISACAGAMTAPFVLLHFNELSLASPITNIFAVPMCSASLILGMAFVLTGCGAPLLARIAGAILTPVIKMCEAVAEVRVAYIPSYSKGLPILAMAALVIATAVYVAERNTRKAVAVGMGLICGLIFINGLAAVNPSREIEVIALNDGGERAVVIKNCRECVVCDFEGKSAESVENITEKYGLKLEAAVLYNNAPAGYADYILRDNRSENIFAFQNEGLGYSTLYEGAALGMGWVDIELFNDCVCVSSKNDSVRVGVGTVDGYDSDGAEIIMLKGITVIRSDGVRAFKGDFAGGVIMDGGKAVTEIL